jgi:hypothetical protein
MWHYLAMACEVVKEIDRGSTLVLFLDQTMI